MSRHRPELTQEEKVFFDALVKWSRGRYMNYAKKKDMTYNQALNFLFRRPFDEQKKELDRIVDPEYHSTREPKLETIAA